MDANYNLLDRIFHRLILAPRVVGEILFDLEKSLYFESDSTFGSGNSVYVCGLARAGTTILMRALYETNQFASLTYQDMPMVIAPNIWSKISSVDRRRTESVERAHGDGIRIDNKSPESFEEVFWRVVDNNSFIKPNGILSYTPDKANFIEYRKYQKLVCMRYRRNRYLSKNNNNLFRLEALSKAFTDDIFLVPFRNPLSHSQSLLDQHRRFSNNSRFESDYMKWLGHFEFGDTHKHFLFADASPYKGEVSQLGYWLEVWVRAYAMILKIIDAGAINVVPICYEQLCLNEPDHLNLIAKKCALTRFEARFAESPKKPQSKVAKELVKQSERLYDGLFEASNRLLEEK